VDEELLLPDAAAPAPEPAEPVTPPPVEAGDGGRDNLPSDVERKIEEQKRRNAGLQRRLQKELEEKRRLEQRLRELEETILLQSMQHLPPEERAQRLAAYRQQREMESRTSHLSQIEQELEAKAKALVIAELSRRYGVPPEELEPFNDPEAMERYARRVGELQRGAAQPARYQFEGAEPRQAPPRQAPRSLDEAVAAFRKAARRLS